MEENNVAEAKPLYYYKRKGGSFGQQFLWNAFLFLLMGLFLALFLGLGFMFISLGIKWTCSPIIVPILFLLFMLIVVQDLRSMIFELVLTDEALYLQGFWKKSQSIGKDEIIEFSWQGFGTLKFKNYHQSFRLPLSRLSEKDKTILLHYLQKWIPNHLLEIEDQQYFKERRDYRNKMHEPPSNLAASFSSLKKAQIHLALFWLTIIISIFVIAWFFTFEQARTSWGLSILYGILGLTLILQFWISSRRRKIDISEQGVGLYVGNKITFIDWCKIEAIQWQTAYRKLVIWSTNKKFASKISYAQMEQEGMQQMLEVFDEYVLYYDIPFWVNHEHKG